MDENVVLLGKPRQETLTEFVPTSLKSASCSFVGIFHRCCVNDVIYYAKCYTRTKKRNSFTVLYITDGMVQFGVIDYFVCVSVCGSYRVFAYVLQLLQKRSSRSHFNLPHSALDYGFPRIILVQNGSRVLVPVNFLLCKLVYVNVKSEQYVCIPPNTLSLD